METEFEAELISAQAALELNNLDELPGGVTSDLLEIASNVTYKKQDGSKKSGPKLRSPGRMTLQDYEVQSQQNKSFGPKVLSSDVNSQLMDFHGIQEIIEKDDSNHDESCVEIGKGINTQDSKRSVKKKSPERIIKGENAN